MYKVYCFDADETLFDYAAGERAALAILLGELGLRFNEGALATYREINQDVWKKLEAGTLNQSELRVERFTRFFGALGAQNVNIAHASELYLGALSMQSALIDGARELVAELKKHAKLAMVTNGIATVQRSRMQRSPLGGLFDALIISEENGVKKPHPQMIELALKTLGHRGKKDVLMVGDSLSADIACAWHAGVESCWYNPKGLPLSGEIRPTFTVGELKEILAL